MKPERELVTEWVDTWALVAPQPMEPVFALDFDWETLQDQPGCYRIVRDSSLVLTLAVGEAGRLYHRLFNNYRCFRNCWVQMIQIIREPDEYPGNVRFRRLVETIGGQRFQPVYGEQHGGLPMEQARALYP
jgi:hypothetical protein